MPVLTPMPATAPYWNFIKDSPDEVKLNLITLLSMSIEQNRLRLQVGEGDTTPYTLEKLQKTLAKSQREYEEGAFYTQEEAHKLIDQFVQQRISHR